MRLSRFFLPTMKETPADAEIVSHRLMLRSGMIKQSSAGIYSWLPMGQKVLRKISQIVREEQDKAGAQEILMPTLQPSELWAESGRSDAYGPELLRIKDRRGRELLYGPTAEEVVTDIFRTYVKSYKNLPVTLYNIQWKFRDEVRPRFGVMRGREFLMKDAYSFDVDYESATKSYKKMFVAYLRTFNRMGLRTIPMRADTGPIGGNLSHEFIVLASTGESQVFCHKNFLTMDIPDENIDYDSNLDNIFNKWTSLYAATEEMYQEQDIAEIKDDIITARGIEVGQVFYLGKKYSSVMKADVVAADGKSLTPEMGCYGIGVSRLIGAIIEASHDDAGIIWPEAVAPFLVGLINLKSGDEKTDKICNDIYEKLLNAGVEVLYDDREDRAGVKFKDMDLIGLPWQFIVGPKGLENGKIELKRRKTGEKKELTIEEALNFFINK